MKDDLLKRKWELIGSQINTTSSEEIENIFRKRSKKVTDSFLLASAVGTIVFPILFAALVFAMLDRWDDVFYRFNNMFLCGYTGYKFYNSVTASYRIRYIGPNLPLKDWLKRWVNYKQKFGKTRGLWSILFIPVFIVTLFISVYPYISGDSVGGILNPPSFAIGFLSALITARILAILIRRKRQLKQLQYLQDLYYELCEGYA